MNIEVKMAIDRADKLVNGLLTKNNNIITLVYISILILYV